MPFLIKTSSLRKAVVVATSISLSCLFALGNQPQVYAATPAAVLSDNDSIDAKVAQLETHFFDHPFSNESTTDRLDRLETMVFGQKRTGTEEQRVNALALVMPPQQPKMDSPAQHPTVDQGVQQPIADRASRQPYVDRQPLPPANNGVATGLEPTVSQLETQVFGTTHKGQSIASRLNTLEDTVFSADGNHNGSFGDRISRLNMAVGGGGVDTAQASVPPPASYQRGYTSTSQMQQQPQLPKMNNGHPVLKKAAEAAIIVGAVAGVAALTIMATKGMGGSKHGLFKKFDLD